MIQKRRWKKLDKIAFREVVVKNIAKLAVQAGEEPSVVADCFQDVADDLRCGVLSGLEEIE